MKKNLQKHSLREFFAQPIRKVRMYLKNTVKCIFDLFVMLFSTFHCLRIVDSFKMTTTKFISYWQQQNSATVQLANDSLSVNSTRKLTQNFLLIILFLLPLFSVAQTTTVNLTTVGFGIWHVPYGVTSITVECYGGGGGGGGRGSWTDAAPGGGGGGYGKSIISVNCGQLYYYAVGGGGAKNGGDGGDSWFGSNQNGSSPIAKGAGGGGGGGNCTIIIGSTCGSPGSGGTANVGNVTTKNGGNGGEAGRDGGGGGGGAGGLTGDGSPGNNGGDSNGGGGGAGGGGAAGSGGAGGDHACCNGGNGNIYGGGGGGPGDGKGPVWNITYYDGGVGAQGIIIITYTTPSTPSNITPITVTGSTTLCAGQTTTLTPNLPTGGTISMVGTDRVHKFTSSATSCDGFSTPYSITGARILIVGGGGGGGQNGGGGGSPAGSDTQIQYNNAGAFGADAGFTRDIATGNTNISATYSGNLFKQQINSNIESLGYEGSAMTFSDGSGNTGFRGLYINTGKGDYVILDNLTLSDGTAVSNEINSGSGGSITTYTYNGTSFLSGTSVIASDAINIYNDVGAGNELGFFVESGTLLLGNRNGGNGTKITIDDVNEQITIGTLNGSDALTILKNGQTGVGIDNFETNTNGNIFQVGDGGTNIIGYVDSGTGAWVAVSDARQKHNITDIGYGLDILNKLHPVSFDYNRNNEHTIGFLAQEVKDIIPEAVFGTEEKGYGMSYATLTPVVVKAIQEMDIKITDINDLTKENTWRDALIAWFESTTNGIRSLVVHDKICVDDQCLTKDDIKVLLEIKNANVGTSQNNSQPVNNPPSNSDPVTCTTPQVLSETGDACIDPVSETPSVSAPVISEPAQ